MTISEAQQVQLRLTDKYVIVRDGIPELRRFRGLTGKVKTVNMSGRALVQFDGPVDIGWYDIDPDYLQIVDQPLPKKAAEHGHGAAEKPAAPAKEKSAAAPQATGSQAAGGKSPLDLIRQQGGVRPAAAPAAGKVSPLDLIRQQGAAKSTAAPAATDTAAPAPGAAPPASATAPQGDTKGLSPLELIRRQGAAKR